MRIVLAEDRNGQLLPERSFTKPVVVIGRDDSACDIPFQKSEFPMVSRRHAELRWSGTEWILTDLGSSYGTILNGKTIEGPTPVPAGSAIRFGPEGPVLKLVWYDLPGTDPRPAPEPAPKPEQKAESKPAVQPPPPPQAAEKPAEPALLEFPDGSREPFAIKKLPISIGREEGCDLILGTGGTTVSRRHAELRNVGGEYLIIDCNSFNGTVVNGRRITGGCGLKFGDTVQLGPGGPSFRLAPLARQKPAAKPAKKEEPAPAAVERKTIVARMDDRFRGASAAPELIASADIPEGGMATAGRGEGNTIKLDGLLISAKHAGFRRSGGTVTVEDLGSTNGIFVNGEQVRRAVVAEGERVRIGPYFLTVTASGRIDVFDTRAKIGIRASSVSANAGRGKARLIEDVSLAIEAGEFVGIVGPSGSGKSTLLNVLSGRLAPSLGQVLIDGRDAVREFASIRQLIGFVPQDDVVHRELSVERTLSYAARLRLPRDVSRAETRGIVEEVLDVTGLAERRSLSVGKLSGGQLKRVSVAIELLTKPPVLFLDEPTAGLDPATASRINSLFRQLAGAGRTVVMTTHSAADLAHLDKLAVMMSGHLAFFGTPAEALEFFGIRELSEIFDLIAPESTSGRTADEWSRKYKQTPRYRELPAGRPQDRQGAPPRAGGARLGIFGAVRQWAVLSQRYAEILIKDPVNMAVLLGQPIAIALLTAIAVGRNEPRDFLFFVLSMVSIWFGTAIAAREIVRERAVYLRERLYSLRSLPYLASKMAVLGVIVAVQCFMLFVPLKLFALLGLIAMPGEFGGIPQLWVMMLGASVGLATGLFVSAVVRTPEAAASIVPLILIPQILFSGLAGVPEGGSRAIGMLMPSAWSLDAMKRFSGLDTLEPEGADPAGPTKGLGLYEFIKRENQRAEDRARRDLERYRQLGPSAVPLPDEIDLPEIKRMPEDRSGYVSYLHPWMHSILNQFVLMLMFWIMAGWALIALRLKGKP